MMDTITTRGDGDEEEEEEEGCARIWMDKRIREG